MAKKKVRCCLCEKCEKGWCGTKKKEVRGSQLHVCQSYKESISKLSDVMRSEIPHLKILEKSDFGQEFVEQYKARLKAQQTPVTTPTTVP